MKRLLILVAAAVLTHPFGTAQSKKTVSCKVQGFAAKNHRAMGPHKAPTDGSCKVHQKNGFPMPDPGCTPGAINPTVTLDVLKSSNFATGCIRNKVESEDAKGAAYAWYALLAPSHNKGATQTCELDHLVPLELGGGDSMDNIWAQCGPSGVVLKERYFKQKDEVERYLAGQVKAGAMDLKTAQRAIAKDYTQFIEAAKHH
ncbi:hypothetical protein [Occallatibacter riparius]|uniref:HNH endonuclease n=1 Tax=Occallatibacter riparius TaxID=1002689 RepID=A0A9J7BP90_9BACT|nr:hypothetical protein [Occallatibacter riparius]UWZ84528.1 hypothetical protein MOP44_01005 [Occallatibacter riparius]